MADRIVVVGGGAAGLMAAARAAEMGATVLVLEKTRHLGQKIRLTGGGHGNLAHLAPLEEWLAHVGRAADFVRPTIARLDASWLRAEFARHGLNTISEPDGRVFPASRNAHDIVAALRRWCLAGRVQFRYDSTVERISVDGLGVCGVRAADKEISARAVILCAGGSSYPATGSSGDGYALAERLGHTITPLRPGLVPLHVAEPWVADLEGISLRGVSGSLQQAGRTIGLATGDVVFTAEGISGPLAFSLSLTLAEENCSLPADVSLCLVPSDAPDLDSLDLPLATSREATVSSFLREWLPARLVRTILTQQRLDASTRLGALSPADRRRLWRRVTAFTLTVDATGPLERAMVTVGGVERGEIDPESLASRRVPGLYLAGEVIDMAGDTGGYNLHLAFATGYTAGEAAAHAVLGGHAGASAA